MSLQTTVTLLCALCALAAASPASAGQMWTVHHGTTVLHLDEGALEQSGLTVRSASTSEAANSPGRITLEVWPDEVPLTLDSPRPGTPASLVSDGVLHHRDGLIFRTATSEFMVTDWVVRLADSSAATGNGPGLHVEAANVVFEPTLNTIAVEAERVVISAELAAALGDGALAGTVIGSMVSQAYLAQAGGEPPVQTRLESPTGGSPPYGGCTPSTGPDVIVGDVVVNSGGNYSPSGSIDAFAWGTTSCNIGSVNLQWVANSVNHPVIPQNMYRLKTVNGAARFEQIGQGWMKHAFTALTQNLCCTCNGQGGSVLGVGCSDPYTAARNGTQCTTTGGLGPRFQVNAHAGAFIWPYMFRNNCTYIPHTSVTRRCQVHVDDLNPALNAGALYYAEAQYVTPDDAAAMNQNNNASYRQILISVTGGDYTASSTGSTVREQPAIKAWKTHDPTVTETSISTPEAANTGGDTTGFAILAAKATNLGGGTYHYEYSLYNMNSDRSFSSFSVPLPPGFTVTSIGFHDVPYHSGDGYNSSTTNVVNFDGTDWPGTYGGGSVSWALVPATPVENSNALRWGTLYNFRFDCNAPPQTGNVTIGMFKPVAGQPDTIMVSTVVPTPSVPCQAPSIAAIPPQSSVCGAAFNYTATATGTPPFTWNLLGAPPGMTINSSGLINWPTTVASYVPYNVTVVAASQCGAGSDSEPLTLTVLPGDFDGNGSVNVADIPPFTDHLLGNSTTTPCAADVNLDGSGDGRDVGKFLDLMGV